MPPPPEIVEGAGLKGGLEVFNQVVPQDTRCAQGDITAAGEIHVQPVSYTHLTLPPSDLV